MLAAALEGLAGMTRLFGDLKTERDELAERVAATQPVPAREQTEDQSGGAGGRLAPPSGKMTQPAAACILISR